MLGKTVLFENATDNGHTDNHLSQICPNAGSLTCSSVPPVFLTQLQTGKGRQTREEEAVCATAYPWKGELLQTQDYACQREVSSGSVATPHVCMHSMIKIHPLTELQTTTLCCRLWWSQHLNDELCWQILHFLWNIKCWQPSGYFSLTPKLTSLVV